MLIDSHDVGLRIASPDQEIVGVCMRTLLITLSIFVLTGCELPSERQAEVDCRSEGFTSTPGFEKCVTDKMAAHKDALQEQREKQKQTDVAQCKEYGFKQDSDAFAECMMGLEQSRIQRKHDLALQKKQRRVSHRYWNQTSSPRPIQCHNEKLAGGLMTTNCY